MFTAQINKPQLKPSKLADLTKLPNRRYFFGEANRHLKAAKQAGSAVSLGMIDIDHFKSINDNYGHDAGDEVLKALSHHMTQYFADNLVGRFGGEEFAVYFADQDPEEALQRLEKFRAFIEKHSPEFSKEQIHFTLSIGFHHQPIYSLDELIKQADLKLYQAKESGRNKLVS